MSWAAVMLFGSGLVFSTGLVWFFVQAWIFAIEARTIWLIVLLTITTTVAILSQGYLCAVFVSIPPPGEEDDLVVILMSLHDSQGNRRVMPYDPKPRGVTQVNREVFASFPFDATASLVRRKGSDTRPAIGWEIKTAEHAAASLDHGESTGAAACTVAAVDGNDGEDDRESQRRLPSPCLRSDAAVVCKIKPVESPKSGEALHTLAPSTVERGGEILRGEIGAIEMARVSSPRAGAMPAPAAGTCVEDVIESGRAEPLVLEQSKPELSSQELFSELAETAIKGNSHETGVPCESSREKDGPTVFGSKQPQHRHRRHPHRHTPHHHHHHHHHRNSNSEQEMKLCCTLTESGQTDATILLDSDDDDKETKLGAAEGVGQAPGASRLRFGSVGSSVTDCCSDSADVGCKACLGGRELLALERQAREAGEAGEALPPSDDKKALPAVSNEGGSGRLGDDPVVRVSELPDVCAICLGQYATGEDVHVLPCLHIFHAQCLDVWIVGHQSCPYCKADLNVLPPESDPGVDISSAAAYTCSLLSNLTLLVTWPLGLLRECRERRQRWQQQQQQQQQQQPEVDGSQGSTGGIFDSATALSTPAAASLAVPMVDGGIIAP